MHLHIAYQFRSVYILKEDLFFPTYQNPNTRIYEMRHGLRSVPRPVPEPRAVGPPGCQPRAGSPARASKGEAVPFLTFVRLQVGEPSEGRLRRVGADSAPGRSSAPQVSRSSRSRHRHPQPGAAQGSAHARARAAGAGQVQGAWTSPSGRPPGWGRCAFLSVLEERQRARPPSPRRRRLVPGRPAHWPRGQDGAHGSGSAQTARGTSRGRRERHSGSLCCRVLLPRRTPHAPLEMPGRPALGAGGDGTDPPPGTWSRD